QLFAHGCRRRPHAERVPRGAACTQRRRRYPIRPPGAPRITGGAGLPPNLERRRERGTREMTSHSIAVMLHDLFAHMSMVERVSLATIGASAVILALLERVIPYTRGQRFLREGFFDDFAMYTIAQNYVLSIVIFSFIIARLDAVGGFSRLQLLARWPLWLQVTLFVVSHDFYIYWMHRWQHRNRYMWRLHEGHHSPTSVDWLSGSRSHCVEILINQTVEFAPIVLLGASPEVIPLKGAISAVWGMYIHANLNVHAGPLQWIVNGPEMHRWHHAMG